VWRGNTSQRPSTIGIQTSTIWIVASFSNTAAGVSPDYVLTVCDNAEQSCQVFFGKLCACTTASEIRPPSRARMKSGSAPFARCGMSCVLN
jgi:hypothetical protein